MKAAEHRVLGRDGKYSERIVIAFFVEPAVDGLIEPFRPNGETPKSSESFRYGDYLSKHMQTFPEFRGPSVRIASQLRGQIRSSLPIAERRV